MGNHRMRDVIMVLPGITGSVLAERRDNRSTPLWDLSGGALWRFLTSAGGSIHRLAVSAHDPRQVVPQGPIRATGLIDGFHGVFGLAKIDGYAVLLDEIANYFDVTIGNCDDDAPANLIPFPYDWRLSNRTGAAKLDAAVGHKLKAWREHTGEPDAQVILIAHSMGGLVARYWLEVLGGWRNTRALVTFGTPFQGSLAALGYVANGYKKAFVDLGEVLRSCPAVYELMPTYRAILHDGNWRRPADVSIPHAEADYVRAAAEFHADIAKAYAANRTNQEYLDRGYSMVPFIGVHQTTKQSAQLDGDRLELADSLPEWVDAELEGGDGTVPRASATPEHTDTNPFGASFMGEQHGSLQNNLHAVDDLLERLRQSQTHTMRELQGSLRPRSTAIDVVVDDLALPGEPVFISARGVATDGKSVLDANLVGVITADTDNGTEPRTITFQEGVDSLEVTIGDLPPGRYRVTVSDVERSAAAPLPVTGLFEVAGARSGAGAAG